MDNNVTREELGTFFRQHLMHMEMLVFYGKCIVEDLVVVDPDGNEIGSIRPRTPPAGPEPVPVSAGEDVRHTRHEAAHYMCCDVREIDRWSRKGKLTKHRDAHDKPYFKESELAAFYKYKTGFDHP